MAELVDVEDHLRLDFGEETERVRDRVQAFFNAKVLALRRLVRVAEEVARARVDPDPEDYEEEERELVGILTGTQEVYNCFYFIFNLIFIILIMFKIIF